MPTRHRNKQFVEGGYYHIFNRGVDKGNIFKESFDYQVFQDYLKDYLLPKDEESIQRQLALPNLHYDLRDKLSRQLKLANFSNEITLLSFCLMPNHFHLSLKQINDHSIPRFMLSLATRYSMYFNYKYKRVGYLYQGPYKAIQVTSDEQLIYLSKYIHKQALPSQPSSYNDYLGKIKTEWVHSEEILSYFSKSNPELTYESFVSGDEEGSIKHLTLD